MPAFFYFSILHQEKILSTIITNKNGMYAVATFTDHYGAVKTQTIQSASFRKNGSYYGAVIDTMVAADSRQLITVTMYNANGSVYGSCTDSVESYAQRQGGVGLYEAVMKFAISSYNMVH